MTDRNGCVNNVQEIPRAEQVREWLGKLVQCLTVQVVYKAVLTVLLLLLLLSPQDPQAFCGTPPSIRQGCVWVRNGQ